jgi:hypothetical protein
MVMMHSSREMAKVTLNKSLCITSLSGKLGGMVYRTLKSGKIVVSTPAEPRTKPLSPAERKARASFAVIASEVARRMRAGDKRPKSLIWQEVKNTTLQELCKGQVRGK